MQAKNLTLSLMLVLPLVAFAGNKKAAEPRSSDEELPDPELLEFIAEFEPLDDQWVDPIQLNMIFAENRNGKDDQ